MAERRERSFVGRQPDLERLGKAFERTRKERAQIVVVSGEAGVGKSTLIERFADALAPAHDGRETLVVVGHCVDPQLVFVPIVEILRSLASRLGPSFKTAVGVAKREVAGVVPDLVEDVGATGDVDRERMFDGLTQVLTRASRVTPLVVVIEDLHWADGATLDLIRYATLTLGPAPVLLVATVRDEDVRRDGALRAWIGELARSRHADVVALGALNSSQSAELVTMLAGQSRAANAADLHARSGGNPFFLEQLVTQAKTGGGMPERVRDTLGARVSGLPPDAGAVAAAAAVIGPTAPHDLLATVVGLDADELRAGLRSLLAEGILTADTDQPLYRFRHALWQDAVLHELLPTDRAGLHRRVARLLASDPAWLDGGEQVRAPVLAAHWQAAGDKAESLRWSTQAGRVLAAMGLSIDASAFFETALELWNRVPEAESVASTDLVGLLDEAAEAARLSGLTDLAIGHLRRASSLVDEDHDSGRRVRIEGRLGACVLEAGDITEGVAILDRVIAGDSGGDSEAMAWALIWRGRVDLIEMRSAAAADQARRAIALAAALGDDVLLAQSLTTLGTVTADLMVMEEALGVARRVGDASAITRILNNKMWFDVHVTDSNDDVPAVLAEIVEVCARPMPAADRAVSLAMAAATYCHIGQFDQVDPLLDALPDIEFAGFDGYAFCENRFTVALYRGSVAEAARWLDKARAIVKARPHAALGVVMTIDDVQLGWVRGDCSRLMPSVERALQLEAIAYDNWLQSLVLLWAARAAASAASVAVAEGRADDLTAAQIVGSRIRAAADEVNIGAYRLSIEANLAVLDGRPDPDRFASAAAAFERRRDITEAGLTRIEEIDAALALGDRQRAESVARSTYRAATTIGSGLVAVLVADRARRAGLDIESGEERSRSAGGPNGLTAREQEVLIAVADGLSNREIAARLYLGVRTVETHVSRVLAKLGAADRTDAVRLARELGLLPAATA